MCAFMCTQLNKDIARLFLDIQDVRNTKTHFAGFSFILSRNPMMLLERKREREYETDVEERWKELSTVLKISLRWTGCLSKGNVCVGVMQISPNIRRRTAWQRQIIRGVRRCILFMQIFMKFSWSGCDAAGKVWARCRVRLVFSSIKICYTNPMQFKRLHTIVNAIWSISKNAIYLCHKVYWDCAYIQARVVVTRYPRRFTFDIFYE